MRFIQYKYSKKDRLNLVVSLFLMFFCFSLSAADNSTSHKTDNPTLKVVIPGPLDEHNVRNPFIEELLHIIFEKQNINLDLQYLERTFTQGRAMKELATGNFIDLNWSVTSIDREQDLLPIRIPIYRGLVGWRVFIIRQDNQAEFNKVKDLNNLQKHIAVQRYDWPDYEVLVANGLEVDGNLTFSQLSLAVVDGIADYFPRSVLEVQRELKHQRNEQLALEKSILLKYPSAFYFFVNKDKVKLAEIIEKGFEKALNDGDYMALFNRHYSHAMDGLNLNQRKIIELTNPAFPSNTTQENVKYWYKLN